jgi:hypothetical protein
VSLAGANHYGVTDVQSPPGAIPDASAPTLAQAIGVETVARWTAEFLLAQLGDVNAWRYAYGAGDAADANVTTKHLV